MSLPAGFRAAGIRAGIKPSGKPDLALLVSDVPLAWALTTTQNRFVAACVTRARNLYATERPLRALVVNAGNANCATGEQGARDDAAMAQRVARQLDGHAAQPITADDVFTASTGVIGVPLPMPAVEQGIDVAVAHLDADGAAAFANAIRTTDLTEKRFSADVPGGARIVGIAKGSGMIHPNMATMLAFVLTDARIDQPSLRALWPGIVDDTFNQVTVDGDTSTNDMALVAASGVHDVDPRDLEAGLRSVATQLAESIAADGEGATTLLRITVTGAATSAEARLAARGVASSSLVKAAMHGRDPNWGRILSAAGQSGVTMDADTARVVLQGHPVYAGRPLDIDAKRVSSDMNAKVIEIHLDLAVGSGEGRAWGCDLTTQYVHINADYTT